MEEDHEKLQRRKSIISVWLGAIVLCTPAFVNTFPFLYTDTGTYLHCGFQGVTSDIRPMIYGLFIRHISLKESLWLVVFVQALIVSWTIHLFFSHFSQRLKVMQPLVTIVILTLMTGIGEVTGMLMPDFLTAVMILIGCIFLFGGKQALWKNVLMGLLFIFAVASHHSNAYILLLALLSFTFLKLVFYFRKKSFAFPIRRILLVAGFSLAGYFSIPLLHYAYSGTFYWSRVKNVFITNRVNQMGLLKPFLHEYCAGHQYRLCDSIDKIPYDLLWSPLSPIRKTGGMAANDEEYGHMLNDFFHDAYYAKKFAIRTVENGIVQFFTIEGLVMTTEREEGYHYQIFEDELPEFIPSIRRSVQFSGKWDSHPTQIAQRFLVYSSYLFLLFFFLFRKSNDQVTSTQLNLARFIFLALVANAYICAGISMVDVRFQYRVVWIIPMFALMIFYEQWPFLFLKLKTFVRDHNSSDNPH